MTSTIHKFEQAGLGTAPFRVVGISEERGPRIIRNNDGTETHIGAPGQPMGCCDYCGQGIASVWTVEDANGKQFSVGSDCVLKTGDAGLSKIVNDAQRKLRREKAAAVAGRRRARLAQLLAVSDNREILAGLRQPNNGGRYTALHWADWMLEHAGDAGRYRALLFVENTLAAARQEVAR